MGLEKNVVGLFFLIEKKALHLLVNRIFCRHFIDIVTLFYQQSFKSTDNSPRLSLMCISFPYYTVFSTNQCVWHPITYTIRPVFTQVFKADQIMRPGNQFQFQIITASYYIGMNKSSAANISV